MKMTPIFVIAALVNTSTGVAAQQPPKPVPTATVALKPIKTPSYKQGLKPWVKLADVKAKHKGQANWTDVAADDGRLSGAYVSAAPGAKTSRGFHPDTREWFAVIEGEVRVEIEGQEPFTAGRGSLVNIPRQTFYSLETIGDAPSLRWIVNVARGTSMR